MTRGPAPAERGTAAFALAWMGAALVFVLLQVVVLAAGAASWLACAGLFRTSGRAASSVATALVALLEAVLAVLVVRRAAPAARLRAGAGGGGPADDDAADRALARFEWGMLGGSFLVAVVSLVLHGARPGWTLAVGVVDALGAFLLLAGAAAATAYDREWHARAWLAALLLAASSAWTFAHG